MIDCVIPLGNGSVYDDLELRYALRAVQTNLLGYGRIFIIGEKPAWIKNIVHIPFPDKSRYKQKNIMRKVMRACEEEIISEDFLFMNDDHILVKNCQAANYPFYVSGTLETEIKKGAGEYQRVLVNTLAALKDLSTHNFDAHYPILYNKEKFKTVMEMYDWSIPDGYAIKSLYGNTLNITPEPIPDCKIHDYLPQDKLDYMFNNRPCISTSNYSITNPMKRTLDKWFPEKSVYEV